MFRVRDKRLPLPFPGCWKDADWRRNYDRIYMRIMREGPYRNDERVSWSIIRKFRRRGETKCYACGERAETFTLRKAEIDGKFVWVAVRWCGNC